MPLTAPAGPRPHCAPCCSVVGSPLKVQDAYRRLEAAGIVVRMSRPSTKGPNKEFWSVTTKGLLFGKNMTSPGNPRETQPHFFESRADELLAMIAG